MLGGFQRTFSTAITMLNLFCFPLQEKNLITPIFDYLNFFDEHSQRAATHCFHPSRQSISKPNDLPSYSRSK